MPRTYFVYVLASASHELYVGVTGKHCQTSGSASHGRKCRRVYGSAPQIKGWTRRKKIELVEEMNPDWKNFAEGW